MKLRFLKNIILPNVPRSIVLFIDTYISANSFVVAFFIRSNMSSEFDIMTMIKQIPIVIVISGVVFSLTKLHKGVVRHTGTKDVETVFKGAALVALLLFIVAFALSYFKITEKLCTPLSIIVIHFLLNVISLTLARYVFKYLYYRITGALNTSRNIMIYGAGDAGILTSAVFKGGKESENKVIGFIDDDARKVGNKINGVAIFHSSIIDSEFIVHKQIREIIISIQSITSERMLEISDKFSKLGVKVKIVPPIDKWMNGVLDTKQIKEVKIEDLLGRKAIDFENTTLAEEFKDKTILITGAAGSIGSEIAKQVARFGYKKIILLDMAESALFNLQQYFIGKQIVGVEAIVTDVRNKERMELVFKTFLPDVIFHASAYKHVPFMEENPYEAVLVNVQGTKIMADLAIQYEVDKFVMISTDKAVNPTNVMGASKRLAELYVSALKGKDKTKFITTRFGNVLGSNGSVIPTFKAQIKEGGPLTVTHKDITRFFMTIPEACRLVLEAGAMGQGGEIFVFDMGKSVKIFDLAVKMIQLSGLKYPEDIDIKFVGLRPGEKIYEEVLATDENTLPTYNNRIKIARVREVEKTEIMLKVEELCEINKTMDRMKIVAKMKEIIPEFISNNSEFSVLDKG